MLQHLVRVDSTEDVPPFERAASDQGLEWTEADDEWVREVEARIGRQPEDAKFYDLTASSADEIRQALRQVDSDMSGRIGFTVLDSREPDSHPA